MDGCLFTYQYRYEISMHRPTQPRSLFGMDPAANVHSPWFISRQMRMLRWLLCKESVQELYSESSKCTP